MTIEIEKAARKEYKLSADALEDGRAYEEAKGSIYIGLKYGDVVAFSVDGRYVVCSGSSLRFREVDVKIIVKN